MTVQGFSDRIEQMQSQINTNDEKLLNITKLLKLQQKYTDTQDGELLKLKDESRIISPIPSIDLQRRLKEAEGKIMQMQSNKSHEIINKVSIQKYFEEMFEEKFKQRLNPNEKNEQIQKIKTESQSNNLRIELLESKLQNMQAEWESSFNSLSDTSKACDVMCKRLSDDILSRIITIESKIKDLEGNFNDYLTIIESNSIPSATKEHAKSKIDLALIEKKLNGRISESLDTIGNMCKKYLDEQIRIENRVQQLEKLKEVKMGKKSNASFTMY